MMSDISQQLAQQVNHAYEQKTPLCIYGSQSKSFLRCTDEGVTASTLEHTGIINYEPTELVVTVRAGTSIDLLQTTLAEQNQSLAFDPPRYNQSGTIGGVIASGLSGPARPWSGAVRDHVLGTTIINGKGEILKFGGQVMKNVAGYDVSRLMTGAFGTLGLVLDVSFKVLPMAEYSATLSFESDATNAIERINTWSGQSVPLNAACWLENRLYVRLSGTKPGVDAVINKIGGDLTPDDEAFWSALRDHEHVFFRDESYWRLSLPPATPMLPIQGEWFIDWGGAQRWLKSTEPADRIQKIASEAGGYAEQWHDQDKRYLRMPLTRLLHQYHLNLKDAFDPGRILNKGVFYPDL